jgi:hypothetical protein
MMNSETRGMGLDELPRRHKLYQGGDADIFVLLN